MQSVRLYRCCRAVVGVELADLLICEEFQGLDGGRDGHVRVIGGCAVVGVAVSCLGWCCGVVNVVY